MMIVPLILLLVFGVDSGKSAMPHTEKAVFGAGCFWCTEAVFTRLDGVTSVVAGYAGGTVPNPTYDQVCSGTTGHIEVAQITFDPSKITYEKLLETFWKSHDPTSLDRQGADTGVQYRSAIFYTGEEQRRTAEESKAEAQKRFSSPIVTEIRPLTVFYKAENYHQEYFRKHPEAPYCRFVIAPKLQKIFGK